MIYSAYTQIFEEFPTFEAAVECLENHPGSEGREPVSVSLVTTPGDHGVTVEPIDGVLAEPGESQVYRVTVAHEVFGKKFTIEYIVEFGAIPKEEEHGEVGEDGSESGPGDEEGDEQPDEGVGDGGEEPVEAPVDELERWESDGGEPEPGEVE